MPAKVHPWPTRRNESGRYEVLIDGVWLSRQRAWQVIRKRDGRCIYCGHPRHPESAQYCEAHHLARRRYQRDLKGCWPRKPDSLIGPPKEVVDK